MSATVTAESGCAHFFIKSHLGLEYMRIVAATNVLYLEPHIKEMEVYPNDGYVKLFGDYIVVKLEDLSY